MITGILYFIVLHFIKLKKDFFFFYKLKVCGNPVSSKTLGTIFLKACAHSCLAVTLVILMLFNSFVLSLHVLWWSAINNLQCHHYTCFKLHELYLCKTARLLFYEKQRKCFLEMKSTPQRCYEYCLNDNKGYYIHSAETGFEIDSSCQNSIKQHHMLQKNLLRKKTSIHGTNFISTVTPIFSSHPSINQQPST